MNTKTKHTFEAAVKNALEWLESALADEPEDFENENLKGAIEQLKESLPVIAAAPKLLEALYYVRHLFPETGDARRVIEAAIAEAAGVTLPSRLILSGLCEHLQHKTRKPFEALQGLADALKDAIYSDSPDWDKPKWKSKARAALEAARPWLKKEEEK